MTMKSISRSIACMIISLAASMPAAAQLVTIPQPELFPRDHRLVLTDYFPFSPADTLAADTLEIVEEIEFDDWGFPIATTYYRTMPDPAYGMPLVFDTYMFLDSLTLGNPDHGMILEPERIYGWVDELAFSSNLLRHTQQQTVMYNPEVVRYNLADLPEPPRHYRAFVDPETTQIVLTEVSAPKVTASQATDMELNVERKLWIKQFNASLQFSQAYISPNWYQGGNNNLNMLANIFYNVKLNERFYKNLMFETTMQYKLGLNNAPDDSIRNYNISEDLLQITSKFGLKAANRWYYSVTGAFKTQLLSSYPTNSRNMKSAFLSPGELNLGIGMTYNFTNPKKTFTVNASISPLSWNMKTCTNSKINETNFGIKEGRKTVSEYGSSGECNITWKMAYNITYRSRLFAFTDYNYFQGDWEHTFDFQLNRYLSTQFYVHMRYDSNTPRQTDNSWHKFQLKEILSFGLSYSFK